jgi:hypothetical protein
MRAGWVHRARSASFRSCAILWPMATIVAELTTHASIAGIECVNVLHFRGPPDGDPDVAGLLEDFDIAMKEKWRATVRTDFEILKTTARKVAPLAATLPAPQERVYNDVGAFGISGQGDPLPPSYCAVVTFKTASSGRSARGRNFVSGGSEASIDAGGYVVTTGWGDAVGDYYDQLLDRMGEGSTYGASGFSGVWSWVILSRKRLIAGAPEGDYAHAVTSVTRKRTPCAMRSRRS